MYLDFTINIFKTFVQEIQHLGYNINSFVDYFTLSNCKTIILRHDVDKKPLSALKMAEIEKELGITSTYYFRIVHESFDANIINRIANMDHEIGYHYEDFTLARGDFILASELFQKHLNIFRKIYPVKTICMHGSPLSRWDNRLLWNKLNYRDYGIIGEPYLDLDFTKVLYLTDSGRCWNGENVIVRDKVPTRFNYNIKSTFDLIKAFKQNIMPENIMITVHPQRWNDDIYGWSAEFLSQNIKNIIKKYFFVKAANEF